MSKDFTGTIEDFVNTVKAEGDKQVIIDFWAAWCGPCRMVSPILSKIEEEDENVTLIKVDVDANQELSAFFKISSIPTLMFFKKGVANKPALIGALPKDAILEHMSHG